MEKITDATDLLKKITPHFQIHGSLLSAKPYGSGHINDTFVTVFDQSGKDVRYIHQRINQRIFKDIPGLMKNIKRVTEHQRAFLSAKDGRAEVRDSSRKALTLVPTREGEPFLCSSENEYWRTYLFIENAKTYDILQTSKQAYEAAKAFGIFQNQLADIPGERMNETIKDFHNTPVRFEALQKAIAENVAGRLPLVSKEIDFVMERQKELDLLITAGIKKDIPERVLHNDTKLNNVMIDDVTSEGICVIDLDTVMPGYAAYDFGDLIRTSTSPVAEDEADPSKVVMQFTMYEALIKGFLEGTAGCLNPLERELLPFGGKLITLECGIRFLTDFLNGDTYFKVHKENHNLIRCRTQFALVASIENQMDKMIALAKELRV